MLSNQEIQGVSVMTSEVKTKAMFIANANKEAYSLSATNPFLLQCRYRPFVISREHLLFAVGNIYVYKQSRQNQLKLFPLIAFSISAALNLSVCQPR